MSKWSNLLLDINYMKGYADSAAKAVKADISKCTVDEQRLKDAVTAQYYLDQLLLDEQNLIDKWAQFIIRESNTNLVVFRGSKTDCETVMKLRDNMKFELDYTLPNDTDFNWRWYFEEIKELCEKVCRLDNFPSSKNIQ